MAARRTPATVELGMGFNHESLEANEAVAIRIVSRKPPVTSYRVGPHEGYLQQDEDPNKSGARTK